MTAMEIENIQLARLCDEARAVLNSSQISEIAESMSITRAEVEDRFRYAQMIFERTKPKDECSRCYGSGRCVALMGPGSFLCPKCGGTGKVSE